MARFIARIGRALSTHYLHVGGTRVLPAELTRGFLGMLSRAVWRSGLVGLFLAVFFYRRFHRFQNVGRIVFVVKKLVLLPASIDAQIELA